MSENMSARDADEAAAWAVRLEERGGDPRVAEGARTWLAGDARRAGALLRAQAALSLINRTRVFGAEEALPVTANSRRRFLAWGAGSGLLAASLGGLAVLAPRGRRLATDLGEVRKSPLGDGSVAAVNTDSVVYVDMRPRLRRVAIDKGEAWFKVAKDAERPFVVEAGDVRVRAIGTAFSVRRREGGADVLVTEGVVETWRVGQEDRAIRVAAGSKAFVSDHQPPQAVAAAAEVENTLAWRDGQIAIYGQTLAEAASEFNRYNTRKIVIPDPQLAGEKVVGQFRTDDPETFAQVAAASLGATLRAEPGALRLYRE